MTYTVRVTRPDGSVTFRGNSMPIARAEREAEAWLSTGDDYQAEVLEMPAAKAEIRLWQKATKAGDGSRYFPASV